MYHYFDTKFVCKFLLTEERHKKIRQSFTKVVVCMAKYLND